MKRMLVRALIGVVVVLAVGVALFLGNGRVIRGLTDQGWRLFDAAATWAASE